MEYNDGLSGLSRIALLVLFTFGKVGLVLIIWMCVISQDIDVDHQQEDYQNHNTRDYSTVGSHVFDLLFVAYSTCLTVGLFLNDINNEWQRKLLLNV